MGTNSEPSRPKPLIVKLKTFELKQMILRNAPKLKDYRPNNSSAKIFISNDLTKKQQQEMKTLREELARRRASGENLTIYRGKIVPKQREPRGQTSSGSSSPQRNLRPRD